MILVIVLLVVRFRLITITHQHRHYAWRYSPGLPASARVTVAIYRHIHSIVSLVLRAFIHRIV